MNHQTIHFRSREDLLSNAGEISTANMTTTNVMPAYNSITSTFQNAQQSPSAKHCQISTTEYNPICHSSTPKISNDAVAIDPSKLFVHNGVSPVVLRDTNRHGSQRSNNTLVQNSNPSVTASLLNTTSSHNPANAPNYFPVERPSSFHFLPSSPNSSMINIKHANNPGCLAVEQSYKDSSIINKPILHLENGRKRMSQRNDVYNRLSADLSITHGLRYSSASPIRHSTTNVSNANFQNKVYLHDNKNNGNDRFSLSRKSSPTKVDYSSVYGECATTNGHVSDNSVQQRISSQEQILWSRHQLSVPPSTNTIRKHSSPSYLEPLRIETLRKLSSPALLEDGLRTENISCAEISILSPREASTNHLKTV